MNTLKIKLSIFYLKFKLKQKPCLDFNFRNERFRMVGTNENFWKELSNNRWEPDTFNILDHYLKCNMVYMDVGAWIGPTVCYAAKKADLVIAF